MGTSQGLPDGGSEIRQGEITAGQENRTGTQAEGRLSARRSSLLTPQQFGCRVLLSLRQQEDISATSRDSAFHSAPKRERGFGSGRLAGRFGPDCENRDLSRRPAPLPQRARERSLPGTPAER